MSGPKHAPWTPGPWGYGVPVKGGRAVVADANGNVVCVIEGGPLRREVTIANAQLIAAAPRLAEALKQLLDYTLACELVVYDVGEQHNEHPVVAAARAALRESGVTDA